ncbi:MAG: preprotein translocase subunit YajC [Rectinemataceae bacterium]
MNSILSNLSLLQTTSAGGSSTGQMVSTLVTFGLVFVIFYFLIIRPQNKKQKEAKKMIEAVKKGDKVVTIGGVHGTVHTVKESTVIVKVDDDARIEFSKSAIASVAPRNEEKIEAAEEKKPAEDKKSVEDKK